MVIIDIEKANSSKLYDFKNATYPLFIEQSYQWSCFQKSLKSRLDAGSFYIADNEEILLYCSYSVIKTIFNHTYLHINRGPIIHKKYKETVPEPLLLKLFFEKIDRLSKKYKSIYTRYDFPWTEKNFFYDEIKNKTKKAHSSFQPKKTIILDLIPDEETILKQMKPKGRYNIKLASKKQLNIEISNSPKDIETFYQILKTTGTRDSFFIQPLDFYKKMLKHLSGNISIFLAKYQGEVISANIVTYYQDTATYYYGASDNQHRNLMSTYLLQYNAIKDAKNKGLKHYDLLGIAENDSKNNPWAGITSFKRKFGGKEIKYLNPREQITKPLFYYLLIFIKKILKLF